MPAPHEAHPIKSVLIERSQNPIVKFYAPGGEGLKHHGEALVAGVPPHPASAQKAPLPTNETPENSASKSKSAVGTIEVARKRAVSMGSAACLVRAPSVQQPAPAPSEAF